MNSKATICFSAAIGIFFSACASHAPLSLAQPAPPDGLACVQRAAMQKGYAQVAAFDQSTVLLRRAHKPAAAKAAVNRVLSFGFVGAEQGREDRLLISRSDNAVRIDVVGVMASGSDVPASEVGRKDARELMSACAVVASR